MDQGQFNSPDIENWLRLINADSVGPKTLSKLIKSFGSIDGALGASASRLTSIDGIGSRSAEKIVRSREAFDAKGELEHAEKLNVWIINLNDPRYPVLLKKIYDPPPVLYIKGSLIKQDNLAVSMVGARRCSLYGQEQAGKLAHMLASIGFTIVSGLARGIDTTAHQGALAADGRTFAVTGCGLAKIFPPENEKLFKLISKSGACISELPLDYEPLAENFPPRNRIIAGLTLGTIVVEAAARSGSLITARLAMENDREVMAVPGKIDSPLSRGPHMLIKQGAAMVESPEDVVEALGHIGQQLKEHTDQVVTHTEMNIETPLFDIDLLKLSEAEREIYDCLSREPVHLEQLIAEADLSPGSINASLVSLRLKGLIKQLPGSMFLRK